MNKEVIILIILSIIGINYLYINYLTKHNKIRTLKIIRTIFIIIPIIVTLLIIVGYPIYDYLQGTWGTGFIDFGIFNGTIIFLYLFVNGGWLFYLLCFLNIVFITTRLVKLCSSPDVDMETIIIPTTKIIPKVKEEKSMNDMFEENLIETREKKHKKTKILSIVCIILSIFYPIIILVIFDMVSAMVLDIIISYKIYNICIASGYIIILLILVVNLLNYFPKTSEESSTRKKVRKFNIIAIIILMLSCIGWGYRGYSTYYAYKYRPQDIICFPKDEPIETDILNQQPLNQEDKTND